MKSIKKDKTIMTILLLTIIYMSNSIVLAQNFDVRKVNWGMTVHEVINSEYPMKPEINGNEVHFYNVDIGNSFTAKLIYDFTNGKLTELKYIVYGSEYSRGTCDKIIPLFDKVRYSTFIFTALKEKGYKCQMGWYLMNSTHLAQITGNRDDYWNCSNDYKTISLIDSCAKKQGSVMVVVGLRSERTRASFVYNEHQNYVSKYERSENDRMPCKSDYFNTYFWLTMTPSSSAQKELDKNRF